MIDPLAQFTLDERHKSSAITSRIYKVHIVLQLVQFSTHILLSPLVEPERLSYAFRQKMLGGSGNPKIATFDRRGGVEETTYLMLDTTRISFTYTHFIKPGLERLMKSHIRDIFLTRIQMIYNI